MNFVTEAEKESIVNIFRQTRLRGAANMDVEHERCFASGGVYLRSISLKLNKCSIEFYFPFCLTKDSASVAVTLRLTDRFVDPTQHHYCTLEEVVSLTDDFVHLAQI